MAGDAITCPSCGSSNPASQRFCGQCGAALARACPACGTQNAAANRFCGSCGAGLDAAPAEAAREPVPPGEERRWATVLFADLAGFTSLAEAMDPEDVKALAARCAERTGEEVRRYGGTVITVLGDAMMAVFGAPIAHEDDAERAVRAALSMRERVRTIEAPRRLELHIGINTGEVMAGLMGPAERRDYTAMGDTTNTAARLMSAAPPGSVYVGEETHLATRRAVTYREIGSVTAKGKERPVLAWEVLDVVPIPEGRPLGTAPLVGRDQELALLADLWAQVSREARTHLVTVIGEPGVGKSRLAAEFAGRFLSDALTLHGRCLPYGEALGYWALATMLKEAAGIAADDSVEAARAKLERLVVEATGPDAEAADVAAHLALLMGLEPPSDAPGADQRTLHTSARRFVAALARTRPLCLVFEDLHWADDSLLDLIELIAARVQGVPLLILAQARPDLFEKRPAWGGGVRSFTSLTLEPLGDEASRLLVDALCRERGLEPQLGEQVARSAEGNPLFAEEIVAMITERGVAGGIPSTLKALIAARIDSLPAPERATLQVASVFGKTFWEGGLAPLDVPGDVRESLEALERKDLLRAGVRSQFRGDREFSFKHDLIRDVAYETLPRARRRDLHGRVADWIEGSAGERLEEFLDVLAHHAVQADQRERALDNLIRAAERARRAAAHRKQVALLGQALEIAPAIGRADLIAGLRSERGRAFTAIGMWPDARREFDEALAALSPEDTERRAEILTEATAATFWMLDVPSLRRMATEGMELAEAAGRFDLAAAATGWLSAAASADGDLVATVDLGRRALAMAGGIRHASFGNFSLALYWAGHFDEAAQLARELVEAGRSASDTFIIAFSLPHVGLALAGSGRYAEAAQVFEEARLFGREYEVGPLLARGLAMSAGFHLDVFDFGGAQAIQQEARDVARTLSFPPPLVSASIDLMLNFARRGEPGAADGLVPEIAETIEKAAGWHGWLWKLRFAEAQAETALAREDWEEALRRGTEVIEASRARSRVKYEAAGLTSRATALLRLGRTAEAIADLRAALAVARRIGDPALLLRPAGALLAVEGDDALAAETTATVERMAAALPGEIRTRFEEAEPVRAIAALVR